MRQSMKMQNRTIRWKLMSTTSALVLTAYASSANVAKAGDADRPTIWIELGAQSEQMRGLGDPFAPSFMSGITADGFASPLTIQRVLGRSFGEEGEISFQPKDSDWIFAASIRYGRASGNKKIYEQTPGGPRLVHLGPYYTHVTPTIVKFSQTRASNSETHAVLDFQAGNDIGLGLFGKESRSIVSFGVRFAQFSSKQTLGIHADPDFYFPSNVKYAVHHHTYTVASDIDRSFHGVGPSISWNASASLIGDTENGDVTLDWGVNAAILFGRQKVRGHHQTTGAYYKTGLKYRSNIPIARSASVNRSRAVTVPNVSGFAGLSVRYSDVKLSLGYRADFFFDAIDSGVDARKTDNRDFYGPFASVSVGIGD